MWGGVAVSEEVFSVSRTIILAERDTTGTNRLFHRINNKHPIYLPLSYPLMYLNGGVRYKDVNKRGEADATVYENARYYLYPRE